MQTVLLPCGMLDGAFMQATLNETSSNSSEATSSVDYGNATCYNMTFKGLDYHVQWEDNSWSAMFYSVYLCILAAGKWLGYTKLVFTIVKDADGSGNFTYIPIGNAKLTCLRIYRPVDYLFMIVIRVMVWQLPTLQNASMRKQKQ